MRAISTICWLILAASPCFAQSPQASTEITTMISQAPLLAALDRDNSSPLSLASLFKKIHTAQKLPLPAVAAGPTRASDLSGFKETYAPFAGVMSADIGRITAGLGIDWEKEILKTYDPKSARTEAGKTLRLNGNVSAPATACSSCRAWSTAWIAAISIRPIAANCGSSTGSVTKSE
jgi:hypothetical protein